MAPDAVEQTLQEEAAFQGEAAQAGVLASHEVVEEDLSSSHQAEVPSVSAHTEEAVHQTAAEASYRNSEEDLEEHLSPSEEEDHRKQEEAEASVPEAASPEDERSEAASSPETAHLLHEQAQKAQAELERAAQSALHVQQHGPIQAQQQQLLIQPWHVTLQEEAVLRQSWRSPLRLSAEPDPACADLPSPR